jgi:hypothetical protein
MQPIRLAGLALLVAAASCSDATAPTGQVADLDGAHQLWRAQKLHTYAFTLQSSCFCVNTPPLQVLVLADTVAGVFDLSTGTAIDPRLGETVEDLFAFVQNAIDRKAHLIRANFDESKGFPTEIDYDGSAQVADDEIFYKVTDVHPVAPPG